MPKWIKPTHFKCVQLYKLYVNNEINKYPHPPTDSCCVKNHVVVANTWGFFSVTESLERLLALSPFPRVSHPPASGPQAGREAARAAPDLPSVASLTAPTRPDCQAPPGSNHSPLSPRDPQWSPQEQPAGPEDFPRVRQDMASGPYGDTQSSLWKGAPRHPRE